VRLLWRLTLEISGRCHIACQITVARRGDPLDRIVRRHFIVAQCEISGPVRRFLSGIGIQLLQLL